MVTPDFTYTPDFKYTWAGPEGVFKNGISLYMNIALTSQWTNSFILEPFSLGEKVHIIERLLLLLASLF